jgi:hypothetical protein
MTHSVGLRPSIAALRKAHPRRRANPRLPGAISDNYCSAAEPVKPEPAEPTMRLLPSVTILPSLTTDVAPHLFWCFWHWRQVCSLYRRWAVGDRVAPLFGFAWFAKFTVFTGACIYVDDVKIPI